MKLKLVIMILIISLTALTIYSEKFPYEDLTYKGVIKEVDASIKSYENKDKSFEYKIGEETYICMSREKAEKLLNAYDENVKLKKEIEIKDEIIELQKENIQDMNLYITKQFELYQKQTRLLKIEKTAYLITSMIFGSVTTGLISGIVIYNTYQ